MNRCRSFLLTWALALSGAGLPLLLPAAAQAQGTPRNFPESALRGKLVVTLPPHVTLNGKPDRLSPGARIHDTANLLVLSGGLDADNVTEAVRRIRPWAVDVSSGVESAKGIKDAEKIAAFVAGVRHAIG